MIALIGSTPKYRPSSESADCQFMRVGVCLKLLIAMVKVIVVPYFE